MNIGVMSTASRAKAVQEVRYQNNKRIVVKHFISCHTDKEQHEMLSVAMVWIKDVGGQLSIFPKDNPNTLFHINHSSFLGNYYTFFYDLKLSWIILMKQFLHAKKWDIQNVDIINSVEVKESVKDYYSKLTAVDTEKLL